VVVASPEGGVKACDLSSREPGNDGSDEQLAMTASATFHETVNHYKRIAWA
jgi:hypothetical protein